MANIKRLFQPVNIYFALWCLYRLQGPLYPSGSIIAKILLLIILIWSLCLMFKVNMRGCAKSAFLIALNVFLLVTSIYGTLLIISGQELYVTQEDYIRVSNFDYLKHVYMSLLPIYVFYYYTKKGFVSLSSVLSFAILLLSVDVLIYFHARNEAMILASTNSNGFTLNVGYNFLAIMPLLLFFNNKKAIQYTLLLVVLLFIMLCMKRGAIIIGCFCFLYFLYSMIKSSQGRSRILIVFLSIIAMTAAVFLIGIMLNSNNYFSYRVQQTLAGDTSNRGDLYMTYYNYFISEQNLFRFIFGNGANATLKVGTNFAHNDWLELAINNGVLGLLLYISLYLGLVSDYKKLLRRNPLYASVVAMTLAIMFFTSLFSMSYASLDKSLSIALGFTLAQINIKENYSKNMLS